jgi:lipopolysaccharide transport system ATP-binding protein
MTTAIEVEGLGKRYRIGALRPAYRTLGDALPGRRREAREVDRDLWALRDVSFSVPVGDAVGVIGANGAGKSTLLKILTRITEPSVGEARVRGRVGSLLEVGTGFHPELTGRENVYLNGAILGMSRQEIRAKFDEIVEFAEVARFMDTPVKRYSSGMYVRLAFAVAAHLETDILLVDEVLSVGDIAFQRKCLGKMQEQTGAQGRTILFVSHNLASVKSLTERCIWLDGGRIRAYGPTDEVFRGYVAAQGAASTSGRADLSNLDERRPRGKTFGRRATFEWIELSGPDGRVTDTHLEGEPIRVRIMLRAREDFEESELELLSRIHTLEGSIVTAAIGGRRTVGLVAGELYETGFTIDPNVLRPGAYQLELYCLTRVAEDLVPSAITFRVEANPQPGDDPRYGGPLDIGVVRSDFPWEPLRPAATLAVSSQEVQ